MERWYTDKSVEYYSSVLVEILPKGNLFSHFYLCVSNISGIKMAVLNDDIPTSTLDNLASREEFFRWIHAEMKRVFVGNNQEYYVCFPEISKSFFIKGFTSLDQILKFIESNDIIHFRIIDKSSGILLHSFEIEYYYATFVKEGEYIKEVNFEILKKIE